MTCTVVTSAMTAKFSLQYNRKFDADHCLRLNGILTQTHYIMLIMHLNFVRNVYSIHNVGILYLGY